MLQKLFINYFYICTGHDVKKYITRCTNRYTIGFFRAADPRIKYFEGSSFFVQRKKI